MIMRTDTETAITIVTTELSSFSLCSNITGVSVIFIVVFDNITMVFVIFAVVVENTTVAFAIFAVGIVVEGFLVTLNFFKQKTES